ncbi:MAG: ribose-phosphate diphosphokinase [Acidimicrobiia bacterium]|nr:ribose-phosphate diphosphokinase [Acidimicrobiia bacterium]MBT8213615.1 ribose-phosphate diphosphokinase [Acidimicrobiia bacterium]NNF68200.1 ribose-phosphate diphosphokinase [Acidimicrobiia bacterium]NNK91107.1 ribose-phosphate diphosphokinase [Acidimicrobiia bacterium]
MSAELPGRKRLIVFSGSANEPLAEEVAKLLDVELGGVERSVFANGEIYIRFNESVRGADCFVIQSHSYPVNFHLMEQLIMVDALKRASAKRITAIVPFFGYARQDKKGRPREPISARLVGDLFVKAGVDRIASVDLHTGQIQGFIDKPFDHVTALPVFVDYLENKLTGPTTIVSPDTGRVKLASKYARHLEHLDTEVAFVHKRRAADARNQVAALQVVGDVEGRDAVIVDDMIDTAGTVVAAAELLRAGGATSVRVLATHGVLSDPAADRLKNAPIEEVVITNTLPVPEPASDLDKLTVLSIGPILAGVVEAIFADSSVSEIFKGENVW